MTVLTLNIHHRGEHGVPVPRIIQKICFDRLLARVLFLRAYNVRQQQTEAAVNTLWSDESFCSLPCNIVFVYLLFFRFTFNKLRQLLWT